MFKKSSFEVGAPIKYDPRFGDAFWNSQQQSWMEYILSMMTCWAIVADVWYLPRMEMLVRSCVHVRAHAVPTHSQTRTQLCSPCTSSLPLAAFLNLIGTAN
jgi:hypothetical protein